MVHDEAQSCYERALFVGQGVARVIRTTVSLCCKAAASSSNGSTLSLFPKAWESQDLQYMLPRSSEKSSSGPCKKTAVVHFSWKRTWKNQPGRAKSELALMPWSQSPSGFHLALFTGQGELGVSPTSLWGLKLTLVWSWTWHQGQSWSWASEAGSRTDQALLPTRLALDYWEPGRTHSLSVLSLSWEGNWGTDKARGLSKVFQLTWLRPIHCPTHKATPRLGYSAGSQMLRKC